MAVPNYGGNVAHLVDGLTSDPSTWINKSLISVTQFTPSGLNFLFDTAIRMRSLVKRTGGDDSLRHRVLASVFFEASTRTSCSFQVAMMRLGGSVIHIDAGKGGNTSSKKGESVSDTMKCLQCYTDISVLRHPTTGTVTNTILTADLQKPVINAGDGIGEHPTQALLDLFTIADEVGMLGEKKAFPDKPLIVVMLGDLKHGRTVHSLAKLLGRSQPGFIKRKLILRYCSPPSLKMPDSVKGYVEQYSKLYGADIVQEDYYEDCSDSVKKAIIDSDVLYVTRIQKERFDDEQEYNAVKTAYVIDTELMKEAPEKMIVMHPLPRVNEISEEVDSDPRAAYFREMENGLYVRMAILSLILGNS